MHDFCAALHIDRHFAFPERQQANYAETIVKRTKEVLRRCLVNVKIGDNWRQLLPQVTAQLISTPGRSGISPYEAVYGRAPIPLVEIALCAAHGTVPQREAHLTVAAHVERMSNVQARCRTAIDDLRQHDESAYNGRHLDRQLAVGDFVLLREPVNNNSHNMTATFDPSVFQISEITSDVDYLISRRGSLGAQAGTKKTRLVHISDIVRIAWTELVDADYNLVIVRVHDHSDDEGHRNYLVEFPGAHDRRQFKWGSRHDLSKLAQNSAILATYDRLRRLGVDAPPQFQPLAVATSVEVAAATPVSVIVGPAAITSAVEPIVTIPATPAVAINPVPSVIAAAEPVITAMAPVAVTTKRKVGRPRKVPKVPTPTKAKKNAGLKNWQLTPVDRKLRDRPNSNK